MAWITNNTDKFGQKQMAKKDLLVKKVVCQWPTDNVDEYRPVFFPYQKYKKEEITKTNIEGFKDENSLYISKGIHSYLPTTDFHLNDGGQLTVNQPSNNQLYYYPSYCTVVDAAVPVGYFYYMNEHGEIVSDAIKIL